MNLYSLLNVTLSIHAKVIITLLVSSLFKYLSVGLFLHFYMWNFVNSKLNLVLIFQKKKMHFSLLFSKILVLGIMRMLIPLNVLFPNVCVYMYMRESERDKKRERESWFCSWSLLSFSPYLHVFVYKDSICLLMLK